MGQGRPNRIDRGTVPPGHGLPPKFLSDEPGEGIPLDEAAAMFGLETGADLVNALRALGPRSSFEAEALRRAKAALDAEDDTTLDEERIERAALEAMSSSDAQEQRLKFEIQMFRARRMKSVSKAAAKAVLAEGPGTAKERKEETKAAKKEGDAGKVVIAEETERAAQVERERMRVAMRSARLAARPGGYDALRNLEVERISKMRNAAVRKAEVKAMMNALRRAENKAFLAAAKGDWQTAEIEKVRALRAHFAAQAISARMEQTARMARLLKRIAKKAWLKNTTGDKEYATNAAALARAAGFSPNARPLALPDGSWYEAQAESGYDIIEPPRKALWDEMTYDESRALYDSVRSINHAARRKAQDEGEAAKARRMSLAESINAASRVTKKRDREELGRIAGGARDFMEHAYLSHRKAENLMLELDGMQEQGPVWQALFRPLNDAAAAEVRMREAIMPKLLKLAKVFKTLDQKRMEVAGLRLSRDERITIALNWGNAGNREALLNGSRNWSQEQLEQVINTLSDEDWDFVENVWNIVNELWPQIADQERRLTGIVPEKVEGETIELNSGRIVQGQYYPILFDPKLTIQAAGDQMQELAKETFTGRITKAATRRGHTKERVGSLGSNKRVWLSSDGLFRHLDRVIHDLTHREAVRQVARDLDDQNIKTMLGERYGAQVHKYLGRWLQNVAAGHSEPTSLAPIILRHLRVGLTMHAMGFSIRTALAQPLGLFNSLGHLGPAAFFEGIGRATLDTASGLAMNIEEVGEKSPFMRDRMKSMDRDITAAVRRLRPGIRVADRVKDGAFWMIGILDLAVANATWLGAYHKATRAGIGEREAVESADQAVRITQGSGRVIDQADISAGGEAQRLFTSFYTFFSAYHNLLVDTYRKAGIIKERHGALPASVYGSVMFGTYVLIPALAGKLLLDGGPEDDEPEAWMAWAARTTVAYGLAGMVVLRDIGMYIDQGFDYTGPPSTQGIAAMTRFIQQVRQGEVDKALMKSGVTAGAILTHMPGAQINRFIEAYAKAHDGAEAPEVAAAAMGLRHFSPQ